MFCGPQVRDGAMSCLVEIYRHVGERVRMDLSKKGLPQSRYDRHTLQLIACLSLSVSVCLWNFLFAYNRPIRATVGGNGGWGWECWGVYNPREKT